MTGSNVSPNLQRRNTETEAETEAETDAKTEEGTAAEIAAEIEVETKAETDTEGRNGNTNTEVLHSPLYQNLDLKPHQRSPLMI
jgi:hypothetical protein